MDDEQRKMTPKEFWIRLAIWAVFALIVPVVYVFVTYGLFDAVTSTSRRLSGWGIIAIVFTCIILVSVVSQAKKGLSYGNIVRQCIDGYSVLIWVLGAAVFIHYVRNNLDDFEKFLIVIFVSECIAVPINPMRKWAEQNNIDTSEGFLIRTIRKTLGKEGK